MEEVSALETKVNFQDNWQYQDNIHLKWQN